MHRNAKRRGLTELTSKDLSTVSGGDRFSDALAAAQGQPNPYADALRAVLAKYFPNGF